LCGRNVFRLGECEDGMGRKGEQETEGRATGGGKYMLK